MKKRLCNCSTCVVLLADWPLRGLPPSTTISVETSVLCSGWVHLGSYRPCTPHKSNLALLIGPEDCRKPFCCVPVPPPCISSIWTVRKRSPMSLPTHRCNRSPGLQQTGNVPAPVSDSEGASTVDGCLSELCCILRCYSGCLLYTSPSPRD